MSENKKLLGGAFVALLAIVVLVYLDSKISSTSSSSFDEPSINTALVYGRRQCEHSLTNRLFNPEGAKFSGISDTRLGRIPSTKKWKLVGWLSSTNAFGGRLRKDYVCIIAFQGGDPSSFKAWHVVNVQLR